MSPDTPLSDKPSCVIRWQSAVMVIVTAVVFGLLSLAVVANSMTKPMGRDEQMYCTAGALMAQGQLVYRDFSYVAQPPVYPLVLAAVYRAFDTRHYLLVGRWVSIACTLVALLGIVGIFRRLCRPALMKGLVLGLAAAVMVVFNPVVDYAIGYAWNHELVVALVVVAAWVFVSLAGTQPRGRLYAKAAILGALLALACWTRATSVLVLGLFSCALAAGSWSGHRKGMLLAFLAAVALVSIWPLWVIGQAPQAFYLDLVGIPALYGQWLHRIGMAYDKLGLTILCLSWPGYVVLLVLVMVFSGIRALSRNARFGADRTGPVLLTALPWVFTAIAFVPPTMWEQYWAVPVPFFVLNLAYTLGPLVQDRRASCPWVLAGSAVCVATVVGSFLLPLYRLPMAFDPGSWVPLQVHKTSQDIASRTAGSRPVLTLAPLLALEGGSPIYSQLSCGSIVYRVGDLLSPEERAITHTVGPASLKALLKDRPPAAVLVGTEPREFTFLDGPLIEEAAGPEWECQTYDGGMTAYFRRPIDRDLLVRADPFQCIRMGPLAGLQSPITWVR